MTSWQRLQPVQQAPDEPFERIDAERARNMIDEGNVLLIDVRELSEWEEVRIPGAKHVPLGPFLQNPAEHVTQDNVIFSCSVGVRSAIACEMAAAMGRERVYNPEGGITAWQARGYPVER